MKGLRLLLFPFALIYGTVVGLRNLAYKTKIFKSSKFNLPIINVGNLSMGGTGKTPHIEYLIRLLKDQHNLVTLSRGFGRKERGFQIADKTSTADSIGDEPLQYYKKFGNTISVAVEANRVLGVMDICTQKPETNLILLDDAFQHRAIHAGLNILLTTYDEPFFQDYILPVGNLRESRRGKNRADIIIVTKCKNFGEIKKEDIISKIKPLTNQSVFFSMVNYGQIYRLAGHEYDEKIAGKNIVVVSGIAKAKPLLSYLRNQANVLHHFEFNDHHTFTDKDIAEIHNKIDKFASDNPIIITTEKDAMRLMNHTSFDKIEKYPWFYQSIKIELDDEERFNKLIIEYVKENS